MNANSQEVLAIVVVVVILVAAVLPGIYRVIITRRDSKGRKIKSQTKAEDTEAEEIFIRESDEHVE